MNISPLMLEHLLFISICVLGGLLLGGLIERVLFGRLRRFAPNLLPESLSSYRGLGWLAGVWLGIGIALERRFLDDYWHERGILAWKVIGIFIATIYLARILGRLVHQNTSHMAGAFPTVSLMTYVVRITVYILGALIILQAFDISIAPMLTALGVGGLAVALALQDTLSNLFAGIQIIASKKILPGQFVSLEGGQEGNVTDISWRSTTLQTLRNNLVIVPNKTLASTIVTNSWLPDKEISVLVECSVDYNSDLKLVETTVLELASEVLNRVEGAVKTYEPTVRFYNFGPSSIDFRVGLRATEYENQFVLRHEMIKALHQRFKEKGIVIPFPIQRVLIEKE